MNVAAKCEKGSERHGYKVCQANFIANEWELEKVDTLEYPIEYDLIDHQSVFNQREISIDTPNFRKAPRAVLRQNPGIIVMGEMPEAGALDTARSTAETVHRGLRRFTRPACSRLLLVFAKIFERRSTNLDGSRFPNQSSASLYKNTSFV